MTRRRAAGHTHRHGSHEHRIGPDADRRLLWAALILLGGFLIAEVVVALRTGSLALLADAGHMLTDVGAIAAALWALRLAARPADQVWTFGWKRAEILSAAVNGITLLVVGLLIGVEAIRRLIDPPDVAGMPLLVMALIGVVVNLVAVRLLGRANRTSLNVEGAYQHVLTDLFAFLGTVVAGAVILLTGWTRADPIASLAVVVLMLRAAWRLLRDAGRVLLEGAPVGTSTDEIRTHLLEVEHVLDVHDLHVWTVTSSLPALSAHLVVDDSCFHDGHTPQLLDQVQECLQGHFDVEHSTFQFEPTSHLSHERATHDTG